MRSLSGLTVAYLTPTLARLMELATAAEGLFAASFMSHVIQ